MAFEYLDNLYKELKESGALETNLPMKLFFEEYHQKKDTHSITELEDLDSKNTDEVLYIDLNWQEVKDLRKIVKFKNVQYLSLCDCLIKNLEGIEQLSKLQFFDIDKDYDKQPKLQSLPNSINRLINLIELHLSSNQLTAIDLSGLVNLQKLDLQNNQLTAIDLSGLVNLQKLNLGGNQLAAIDLSGLVNLQHLDLWGNQLTAIDLNGLVNLQELNLWHNQLTAIDLNSLVNLQKLHLGNNQLTVIDLNGLVNLQELHLGNNQLTAIDLSGLMNLQQLRLEGNQLTAIDLNGLVNLQQLHLVGNQLTAIDLSDLVNLQQLYLSNNKIDEIPTHAADLENTLQVFDISENPLSKMPEGFASWGLSKQMRFLNQQRGYGYFYTHWDMPEEVAILFSTYLGRFKNIVREKTGKEIHFEIQTEANGLRLVTKAGKDFSLEEINGMLFYYLATLTNQSTLQNQKLEDEIRNLKFRLERTEFENKELNIEISLFKKENIDLRGEKDDLQGKLISLHEQTLSFVMKIQQPQNKHESVTFSIPHFIEILATLKPSNTMIDISSEFKNIGNPQVTNTNTNTNNNSLSNSQAFSVEAFRKEITPFISRLNVIKEDLEEQDKPDEIKPLLEEIIKLLKAAENVAKEEDKEKIKSSSFWTRLGSFYQKAKTEGIGLSKYLTPDNIKKFQENAKLLGKMTGYEFEGAE